MVPRTKNLLAPPAGLMDAKWNLLKANLLIETHTHEAKTECYRDTTLNALTKLYKNKCAICERDRGLELQVDHYRPKKTRNNKSDLHYNQPGYYWLCYDWSNLLPLCSKCNGNKSNKFPLTGWSEVNRISSHLNVHGITEMNHYDFNWLQLNEKPLMLNPEYEQVPEKHFKFFKNGSVQGLTIEGKETIKICKLNRKDLRRERLKIKDKYVKNIKSALNDYLDHNDTSELKGELKSTFKRIRENCHKDSPFSLYNIFIYEYLDYFIGSSLNPSLQGLVNKYFNDFKATHGV